MMGFINMNQIEFRSFLQQQSAHCLAFYVLHYFTERNDGGLARLIQVSGRSCKAVIIFTILILQTRKLKNKDKATYPRLQNQLVYIWLNQQWNPGNLTTEPSSLYYTATHAKKENDHEGGTELDRNDYSVIHWL